MKAVEKVPPKLQTLSGGGNACVLNVDLVPQEWIWITEGAAPLPTAGNS